MDAIQKLSEKIRQATDLIARLKMDNKGLSSEVSLLKDSLREQTQLKQENIQLKNNVERLRSKLEKISGRIDTLLSQEELVLNGQTGGTHE